MLENLIKGFTRDSKWYSLFMEWVANYDDVGIIMLPIDSDHWVSFDVDIDGTQRDGAKLMEILANCDEYTVHASTNRIHYHIVFETFDVYLTYRQI